MDGDHTMTSQDEASLADLPHVNDDDPTSDDLDTGLLDRDNFDDDYGLEGLDQDALFAAHENEDVGGDTSSKSAFAAPTIHGRDSPSGLPSPSKTPFHDSHGSSQLDENTSEPFQERYDWAGLLGDFRVRLQQNRAEDMALQQRFDRLVEVRLPLPKWISTDEGRPVSRRL